MCGQEGEPLVLGARFAVSSLVAARVDHPSTSRCVRVVPDEGKPAFRATIHDGACLRASVVMPQGDGADIDR